MTFGLFLGWFGALTAVGTSAPQVARLVRTRDSSGVSASAWTLCLGASLGWASHGVQLGLPNQVLPNVAVAAASLAVMNQLRRIDGLALAPRLLPAAALGATMACVDHFLGTVVFGLMIPIPGAVGALAQGSRLVRSAQVTGVPVLGLALGAANSTVWLAWALIAHEPGTAIASSVGGSLALFNLVWRVLRACGLRPMLVEARRPPRGLRGLGVPSRDRPAGPPRRRERVGPRRGPAVGRHRIQARRR
jgi:uncharacterized protein with PQ loop repeat